MSYTDEEKSIAMIVTKEENEKIIKAIDDAGKQAAIKMGYSGKETLLREVAKNIPEPPKEININDFIGCQIRKIIRLKNYGIEIHTDKGKLVVEMGDDGCLRHPEPYFSVKGYPL